MKKNILTVTSLLLYAAIAGCTKPHVAPANIVIKLIDNPQFNNVLIIGNSITYTAANPSGGWTCSCGMAAILPDSDYVHHLTKMFQTVNPKCTVTIGSSYAWELTYDNNFDIPGTYASLKAIKPDLVIFRLGEDVIQSPLDTTDFGNHYRSLIAYFTQQGSTILAVGSVWPRPVTDQVMKNNSPNFITLGNLGTDNSIYAFGLFADPGIQQHPNDKGHRLIADTIWKEVQQLRLKLPQINNKQ